MGQYIVFVHGMGEQLPGSYNTFGERLRIAYESALKKTEKPRLTSSNAFEWEEAYWADITQPDQQVMKSMVGMKGKLREFSIGSIGDVVAYSKLAYPPDKYGEIQKRFAVTINKLSDKAYKNSDTQASLTVIAHSLGSVIASDGIYDLISKNAFPQNLKLDNFFTMGSPIALYGLRYGLENFSKPVRPKLWVNFYYPQDLIAFPLKILNSAYASAVDEDKSLSPSGGAGFFSGCLRQFTAMLPLVGIASHSWYFTDTRVIKKIAESLV
jgi:hypothetical protein